MKRKGKRGSGFTAERGFKRRVDRWRSATHLGLRLKPGGLFVTFENIAPRTAEGVRFGLAAWKHFRMDNGRTEQEADQHVARYGKESLPITAEEHFHAKGRDCETNARRHLRDVTRQKT